MLSGVLVNFRMVKLLPCLETSEPYTILILEPSSSVASTIGFRYVTGFPIRSAIRSTKSSSSSMLLNSMLLFNPLKILCSMNSRPTPLQLMSSIFGSHSTGSRTPMPSLSLTSVYFSAFNSPAVTLSGAWPLPPLERKPKIPPPFPLPLLLALPFAFPLPFDPLPLFTTQHSSTARVRIIFFSSSSSASESSST